MISVRIERDYSRRDGFNIWIIEYDGKGASYVAEPIDLSFKKSGGAEFMLPEPTLRISGPKGPEIMRALAEGLLQVNIIPENKLNSNKQIEAMKYHLEDMRKLVFHSSLEQKDER